MINCILSNFILNPSFSIDNYSIILSNPPTIHSPTNKTKIIFTFINFILPELYHTEHPSHLIICAFSLLSTFLQEYIPIYLQHIYPNLFLCHSPNTGEQASRLLSRLHLLPYPFPCFS